MLLGYSGIYIVMAHIVMAYIVMANIVVAYIVMANIVVAIGVRCSVAGLVPHYCIALLRCYFIAVGVLLIVL